MFITNTQNKCFKSKQGNIKIQQSDKDLMKENLLKMVVCGGTSFSFLENQGFHDTISHAIQIGAKYGSSNLLGPGSGFIWVTRVQGQQKRPSFNSGPATQ